MARSEQVNEGRGAMLEHQDRAAHLVQVV
jgi:hypothetical protein